MTKEQFNLQKWGAGMIVKYKGTHSELTSEVISIDFENHTIGLETPITADIVFCPCEDCEIIKDFCQKEEK